MIKLLRSVCVAISATLALSCLPGCSLHLSSLPDDGSPRLIDVSAKERALGEFYAGNTLLFLWASWCPECVVELSSLNIVKRNLSSRDVNVIAVAINDDVGSVRECPPVRNAAYPVLIDIRDQVRSRYPISSLPTTFLLDSSGKPQPLIDPEDGLPKDSVSGFREWQSKAGTRAIIDSLSLKKP